MYLVFCTEPEAPRALHDAAVASPALHGMDGRQFVPVQMLSLLKYTIAIRTLYLVMLFAMHGKLYSRDTIHLSPLCLEMKSFFSQIYVFPIRAYIYAICRRL